MDLGDLLILLLFLFPVLSRLFGNKKPPPQRTRPLPGPERRQQPGTDDPLADALRQIREALGEVEPEPAPPEPLPERPPPVSPQQPRRAAREPVREPEFHGLGAFEHDEHGFGRSNPLSEEVFERKPRLQTQGGTGRIKQKPLKQVDLTTPIEVKRVAPATHRTPADILRDPARAREAFMMKEVLGPPRSRRPWR